MEIYLIRHTTPDIEKGICYGQADIPPANSFEEEVSKVISKFPVSVEVIYTSPLKRCKALSQRLATEFDIPLIDDPGLMELNFGQWEMKKWNDIDPVLLQHWMDDFVHVKCPEGESYSELFSRVTIFIHKVTATNAKSVAVISHAGIIRAIHSFFNKISLVDSMNIPVAFGEIFAFQWKGGAKTPLP